MTCVGSVTRLTLAVLIASISFASSVFAIEGGSPALRSRLSQATVGIGTLIAGSGTVGVSRCSGVLIAPRLVLTAGHCVRGNALASAIVLYNGSRPLKPAIPVAALERYDIVSEQLPSQYSTLLTLSLDTAILRLAAPVKGRAPIPISHAARPPRELLLAGAGLSENGLGFLKTTRLDPVLMTSTRLIVAATRGSQVCKGDSGGPVVAEGPRGLTLWGVASAVLSNNGVCGRYVVIAPASPGR